jgi:uncharacterized protein YuzE
MDIKWDRTVDAAYIYLIDDEERVHGVAHYQVPLSGAELGSAVAALDSLVLDFDREGKLIGIEVLDPEGALRASTLRRAD